MKINSKRVLILAGLLTGSAGLAAGASALGEPGACGPVEEPIAESSRFTPFAQMRGTLPDAILNPDASTPPDVPRNVAVDSIAGLPRQWASVRDPGAVVQYFGETPISKSSLWEFQAAGGAQLETLPTKESGMTLAELASTLGDRAVPIEVGASKGLLVWADPESPSEQRLHHVYWEDDGFRYALILDASGAEAVTAARSVACN